MLSYIGGKSRISSFIKQYIPNDIETYAEPFSGMFWVYFKMELSNYPHLKNIIYNDFNPLNANLFNCVRDSIVFANMINGVESQQESLFYKYQSEIFHPDFKVDLSNPDYDAAIKYAYVLSQVWSGTNPERAKFIDLKGKYTSKFDSFKNKLNSLKWTEYFNRISHIENLDFQKLIEKYDSPKSYFYCDPPYYKTEDYYANHDFGIETHKRLADTLKAMQGRFSLSYYYFDELEEWFPKDQYRWESKEFAKAAMAKAGKLQTKGTELLIMNY